MSKKITPIVIVLVVLCITLSGITLLTQKNKQIQVQEQGSDAKDQRGEEGANQQTEKQTESKADYNFELPDGWKFYQSDSFGIRMAYPEDSYTVSEESGMVHFYHRDGTSPEGSLQQRYNININMDKEESPQNVKTLDELFQYSKNNSGAEVERIKKETEIKTVGNTSFIVTKFYNNETFYSALFVAMGEGEFYRVTFGGFWNIIDEDRYEMILKIMESFVII